MPPGGLGRSSWLLGARRIWRGGLLCGPASWHVGLRVAADGVEVPQRLGVGAHQAGLDIGQPVLAAELADERLSAAQVGSGHAWEQMVFDLEVEATKDEVDQRAAEDVAGGQDLPAQEVALIVGVQDRHTLVVGGERDAQIQTQQPLLDQHEHHGP